jgi:CAP-Gly domain-containing linker protein 1
MTTPGKPRQSGIPGPGRTSGILTTPSRSRSVSSVNQQHASLSDVEYVSLAEAIKANDPAQHRPAQTQAISTSTSFHSQSGRRSVTGRPSSVISTASSSFPKERAKTPISTRPTSRHSDVFGKITMRTFDIGDSVRIESLGYEGTLRYIGEIEGKAGVWAGVELSGGFSGMGKNNGSVSR